MVVATASGPRIDGGEETHHPSPTGISINVWCDEAMLADAIRDFAKAIAGVRKLQDLEPPEEEKPHGNG